MIFTYSIDDGEHGSGEKVLGSKGISHQEQQPSKNTFTKESFVESLRTGYEKMADAQQAWIDKSVKSHVQFLVFVGGYFKENGKAGYGVVIKDNLYRPVIAYSGCSICVDSTFYHELEGVNKGLELAIDHKLENITMQCTSVEVSRFVRMLWRSAHKECSCGYHSKVYVCLRCLHRHYYFSLKCGERYGEDVLKTHLLIVHTTRLFQKFYRQGEQRSILISAAEDDNRSAPYIAEHGNGEGKMTLQQILADSKLLSLLFEEAEIDLAMTSLLDI